MKFKKIVLFALPLMALCLGGCGTGSGTVAGVGTGWRKTKTVVLCEHLHKENGSAYFLAGVCAGCEPYYVSYEYDSDEKQYAIELNEEAYIMKMNGSGWFFVAYSEVEVECDLRYTSPVYGKHVHHLITFAKN